MRLALLASCTLLPVGCFVGIDASLMDRASTKDGGATTDGGVLVPTDAAAEGGASGNDGAPGPHPASDAPADGALLGAWSFEESSGTVANDSSGHGNDAMLVGGLTRVPGLSGLGLLFSGMQQMAVTTLSGPAFPSEGTLSMWFRAAGGSTDPTSESGLFDVPDVSSSRGHFSIEEIPTGNGTLQIVFTTARGEPAGNAIVGSLTGEWNHVVVSWDAARFDVYIGSESKKLTHAAGGSFQFAWSPSGQEFRVGSGWVGLLDEMRLYARALSETDVLGIP